MHARLVACSALGELGDPRAIEPLMKRLDDSDWFVRSAACGALGELGDPRAIEPLIKRLDDSVFSVRREACAALGKLGGQKAMEALIKGLDDSHYLVRKAACAALGRLVDERAVEPLLRKLEDQDQRVRRAACAALKDLGEEGLAKVAMEFLEGRPDAGNGVARLATEGDLRLVPPLLSWLKDGPSLRKTSRAALNAVWQVTGARINALICPAHLARFQKRMTGIPMVTRLAYAACPICGRAWPVVEVSEVVAVLDSASSSEQTKEGVALRVNWLVRKQLFDFDRVEIMQASDEEVQRFLGLLRSDHQLQARCKQLLCRVGEECSLSENTRRLLMNAFDLTDRTEPTPPSRYAE